MTEDGNVLAIAAVCRNELFYLGAYEVLVDAINDAAEAFYSHHGFTLLQIDAAKSRTMFIPIRKV